MEGNSHGRTLNNLFSSVDQVIDKPQRYYVENLYKIQVKTSYTYAKFVVLDLHDGYVKMIVPEICRLLESTDVECVGGRQCNIMEEYGVNCPSFDVNIPLREPIKEPETKPWIYVLVCGFVLLLLMLVVLLFLYAKRRKPSQDPMQVLYHANSNNSASFSHVPLRSDYAPLSPGNTTWTSAEDASLSHEAENVELYNNDGESIHNDGPIYESISSLKKVIEEEFDEPLEGASCPEPRYIDPLSVRTVGAGAEIEEDDLKKEGGGQLVVDLSDGDGEPRYSAPPGRK